MKDRVPLYPGRVKMTPVSGQENTYDMVRADEPTQEGDPLSKATFLKDATAALFGMDETAVPDDALAFLGKYNQHWWRLTEKEIIGATYNISDVETDVTIGMENYIVNVQYSDAVDVSSGVVSLASPITSIEVNAGDAESLAQLDSIKGKFFRTSFNSDEIYQRAQTDSYVSKDGKFIYGYASGKLVSYVPATSIIGDTNYLHSAHRNAYPDSGLQEGYEYQYLGVPFENAVTAPKIATGSYVGTGTFGSNNPNSLIFSFVPKAVFIVPNEGLDPGSGAILMQGVSIFGGFGTFYTTSGTVTRRSIIISWLEKTVSWYDKFDSTTQQNTEGVTYSYLAIG